MFAKLPIVCCFLVALVGTGCAATGSTPDQSHTDVRRIVTINDKTGTAVVLADDHGGNVLELNGTRIVRMWESGTIPVPLEIDADLGRTAGNAYRDGFVGSSFYIADIPPGSDLDDIPMHAQQSLDYIAVLDGEIDLLLPDRTIAMSQGDILVQAGNEHSWVNRSASICRLLVVVLTGKNGA